MIKPLLAFDYDVSKIRYPCFVQPKLNGIRAIWHNGRFISRRGEVWNRPVVEHITKYLSKLPEPFVLDGEFYRHGWPLQKIMSGISVVRDKPNELTHEVSFNYFDIVDSMLTFHMRHSLMERIGDLPNVNAIKSYIIDTQEQGDKLHKMFLEQGYEGSIYRIPPCMYFSGRPKDNRSVQLLRRKHRKCGMFELVDVILGKADGKYKYVTGRLVCKTTEGIQFEVGTGLTDEQRIRLIDEKEKHIGRLLHIEFECYSTDGKPLKPSLVDDSL